MTIKERLVSALAGAALLLLVPLAAPAAAEWAQPPVPLADAEDLFDGDTVLDGNRIGTVAWGVEQAGDRNLVFRRIDASGTPGPVVGLSDPADGDAGEPIIDVTPAGEAIAVWTQGPFEEKEVKVRRIGADGSLGPILDATPTGNIVNPAVKIGPSGFAYVAWMRLIGGTAFSVEGRASFDNGTLGATRVFSSGEPSSFEPQVAIGHDTTTLVAWTRSNPENQIQAKLVTGGGVPGGLLEVAGGVDQAFNHRYGVRPDGSFVVVYSMAFGAPDFDNQAQALIVGSGGSVSAPVQLSALGDSVGNTQVAVAPDGTATAVWTFRKVNTDPTRLEARRLLPDGSAGPPLPPISAGDGANVGRVQIDVDGVGDAIVVWDQEKPLFEIVSRRILAGGGLEPATPQLLAGPSPANPREVSRPSLDVSSSGEALLGFLRSGGSQPTDQVQALRFLPPVPPPSGDLTPPSITGLRLTPRAFRVAGRRKTARPRASVKRRRARAGSRIRLRASEPLQAIFVVQRKLRGRRVGRRCVKPRRALAKARRCTRLRKVGAFTRAIAAPGAAVLPFSGRLGKRRLRPGGYRLSATGVDAAGNATAEPRRAPFRIVRRR